MTGLAVSEPLLGDVYPSIVAHPEFEYTSGPDAVEFAESFDLNPDATQRYILDVMLAEREDGRWAARQVGVLMARQQGKGLPFDIAELYSLFVLEEPQIIHSAHLFPTALKAFRRMDELVTNWDELRRQVRHINRGHGEESIELHHPTRLLSYVARARQAGRGWSAQRIFLDEAQDLPFEALAAVMPTLLAQRNPQVCYSGTVPKPGERGATFQAVRDIGREAFDRAGGVTRQGGVAWLEWAAGRELPVRVDDLLALAKDRRLWRRSCPTLGRRMDPDVLEDQIDTFIRDPNEGLQAVFREFVLIWPDRAQLGLIRSEQWAAKLWAEPGQPVRHDPVVFAIDVSPDRAWASIGVAAWSSGGRILVDVTDHRPGVGWLVERAVDLCETWDPAALYIDELSPAASLLPELRNAEITCDIVTTNSRAMANAAAGFYDDVVEDNGRVVHVGRDVLNTAVPAGAERPLGDSFAWARRGGTVISPLVTVTLARYGLIEKVPEPEDVYESRGLTVLG